ncbi:ankyrin repeat-containing domain, PGG domain protein [Artemisia annua]|uniref:Ankyrin repeat-containing domain, PGG domain protein n=1 Tax=Artemisia annua TaxID=35608 RepID=A0A2U1KYK4_ARTAN|nr:ankyrin repeat-containing domain, PGG domain protein [Artemisia annua]
MAASSSNPSFIVEIGEEYPSPSHVYTPILVTVKLSSKDRYNAWKTQILCLLTSHNMLGFINGKVVRPKGNVPRKLARETEAWMRSDSIVKSWILGSVSEQATMYVVDRLMCKIPNADFTAKDLWDELKCIYAPEIIPPEIGETEIITEEDAKSKYKSKEVTNEDEREKIESKTEAYKFLYEGIVKRKMNWVNHILDEEKVYVTDIITIHGNTALHLAVVTSKDPEFFEELLKKTPENISLTDLKNSEGRTLLHFAAIFDNTPAAKILVEKYPRMLIQKDNDGQTPLAVALSNLHTETAKCLLNNIDTDIHKDTLFSGTSGVELLVLAISSKDFELAGTLLSLYSNLDSDVVLMAIAQNYPCELSFWERRAAVFEDIPILNVTVFSFVKRRVQTRDDALSLLTDVCLLTRRSISSSLHKNYYTNPILEATRQNSPEVVKIIVYLIPDAFWIASEDGHNVIQYAVINRSEKIYNLLNEMSEHKNVYKTSKDSFGNNLLHLAARLAPAEKLNLISGAALRIQYELQWYKEVERFVCSLNITQKNSFGETPQMVFTRTHKDLVTDGEKWMKSAAESYTITAALITTIVFAAAITVPGGNNQNTGVPIFTNNLAFTIFAISDAMSLFTAVMSLLMFLSILTTRFAEEDFLYKLPRKLIIGLVTLFISTTTMIIAFGAALFLVFGQKNASLLIPIGALTGLTITFFVALQFPLVVDLMRATYGRSIFGRNTDYIPVPFNI